MNNPYKKLSDINPQQEKGTRRIATDVFNALIKAKLSGCEYQIVLFVINQTWGFREKFDDISITQFMGVTGISRPGTIKTIHKLETKRILYVDRQLVNHSLPVNSYLFNKHYDTWLALSGKPQFTTLEVKNITSTGKPGYTRSSKQRRSKLVNQSIPYNNNIQKQLITDKDFKSAKEILKRHKFKDINNINNPEDTEPF